MQVELSDEQKKRINEALAEYFREQFDEDLGLLRAQKLFELVVELIGAAIYDRAIGDAQAWMQGKLLDLPGDVHWQAEA